MANYSHPTSLAWEKWLLSSYPRSQAWGPLLQLMSQAQVLVQQTKQAEVTPCRPSQGKSKQPIMPYFPFLDERLPFNTMSMQIVGHKNNYMMWYLVQPHYSSYPGLLKSVLLNYIPMAAEAITPYYFDVEWHRHVLVALQNRTEHYSKQFVRI